MQPAEVRRIGSELQGDGNQVGRIETDVITAGNLLVSALSGTPAASSAQGFATGTAQLGESMNKYHDYLVAFGQSLISAAASYEKIDEHHGRAFASVENKIDQADAPFRGFQG
ncbi:hypothetical protein [Segniliparus rugosus]|uniref:ESX-1 secretion-associated protein n=1 Tax=Segniliparus rugosus (strain ATCC BAA-974 / DSM 45345 / CCUG 50838 / CIP 108380 / JCM 13579 / CDC 945) TaxID=679197 RepID=E5XQJ1_SEGRC|nr:hypothetical protein [Segniliparus rugosus]EFV13389.2 hypothetical protein HMPREF9336_01778 [Segniliparus rugosus ATCC BAA-974]